MEPTTNSRPTPIERATASVIRAAPAIVRAVIEQAKQGSYLHAKFLFDFARISGATPAAGDDALAVTLLQRLDTPPGGEVAAPHPGTVPP